MYTPHRYEETICLTLNKLIKSFNMINKEHSLQASDVLQTGYDA